MWLTGIALSYRIQDIEDKHTHRRGFEVKTFKIKMLSMRGEYFLNIQAESKELAAFQALIDWPWDEVLSVEEIL